MKGAALLTGLRRWLMPRSLRQRLLMFLLAAVSLAAFLQAYSAYRTALAEADQLFDYQMQQMAFSLRGSVAGPGSGTISLPLGEQQSFDFHVQVWSLDGASMFRSPGPWLLPQRAVLGFSDVTDRGRTFRVFSVQTPLQVIQVAQDLSVRQRMASQLAWRTAMPTLLMLPLLGLVVWLVISRSLDPVERVRAQLADRSPGDLAPVPAGDLPSELRPMVQEFNALLGRVRSAFEDQQHFVADAAHELRTPLAALKLQLQALQQGGAAGEPGLKRLEQGIERASHLIEQLLSLARQEGAAAQRALEPLALDALCRQAVADASELGSLRGVDVGLQDCDPAWVMGQPEGLRVLLRNLLDNAIKYSPAGGQVDLSLHATPGEGQVLLLVEDSGPGIPAGERQRVFDRFYRSSASASQAPGSGLGLAIVKAIADRHGAQLRLSQSGRLGGLQVELRLPACEPGALASDQAQLH
ncbi:ATP-binding protein [Roseateles sp. DB2]|uniref:ATP-binding protein n=1 Tax=Roseateles sp. DB2 TaxID=3453717 RepID=UPI003EEB9C4A